MESAERHLRDSLQRLHATGDCLVTLGPAAGSIIEAAATLPAALVVVGTHGRTGLARWVLGSVAERVMRQAPCSVLVVPLGQKANAVEAAAV